MIGMKDQFNIHDLKAHPLGDQVQYVSDEMGFILYDRNEEAPTRASVDTFGPYFIEQYALLLRPRLIVTPRHTLASSNRIATTPALDIKRAVPRPLLCLQLLSHDFSFLRVHASGTC